MGYRKTRSEREKEWGNKIGFGKMKRGRDEMGWIENDQQDLIDEKKSDDSMMESNISKMFEIVKIVKVWECTEWVGRDGCGGWTSRAKQVLFLFQLTQSTKNEVSG